MSSNPVGTVIASTFAKQSTSSADTLSEKYKLYFEKGNIFEYVKWKPWGNNHIAVEFTTPAHGFKTWLFYAPHVQCPTAPSEIISSIQALKIFGARPTAIQLADLNAAMLKFDITTLARERHFMAQIAHESGGLRWLSETASGANYEWVKGLGNWKAGDGMRFKGAGAMMLTGRKNYQDLADYLGDQRVMQGWQFVSEIYPFTSAGVWWMKNNMNRLVDSGASVADVTRIVNGGYNGLDERERYFSLAERIIT